MAWNYRGMQDMNRGTVLRLIVMTVIMLSWASAVEAANPVLQSEREALLALYSSTNGASWTNNSGWGGESGTECTWYGITCTGDLQTRATNISAISLSNNNLSGSVPAQLGNLTYLWGLYFTNNKLTGSIPPELGYLTNLEALYLSSNQLTGSMPPELGNLSSLQGLYLDKNQLTGSMLPSGDPAREFGTFSTAVFRAAI
ncbi:MAG TPA: hypothetical protein VMG30_15770 [Acidobacteriota bacterium]|nr:hypothetical protein [Acidobacteriota bacterium]